MVCALLASLLFGFGVCGVWLVWISFVLILVFDYCWALGVALILCFGLLFIYDFVLFRVCLDD